MDGTINEPSPPLMRIAVTGHQVLSQRLIASGALHGEPEAWRWIERVFRAFMLSKDDRAVVRTCLAGGADQWLAEVALQLGRHIEVIIPSRNYEATFISEAALASFRDLVSRASLVTQLMFDENSAEAFVTASYRLVEGSTIVAAVWDEQLVGPPGSTADTVRYARSLGLPIYCLNPTILTARYLDYSDS